MVENLFFPEKIMGNPPFLSVVKAEGLGTGHEEQTPAMESLPSLCFSQFLRKDLEYAGFVSVQILQPGFGGAGIVNSRPTILPFECKASRDSEKQVVARHRASAEEVTGHPVLLSFHPKGVGHGTMAKHVCEQPTFGFQPRLDAAEELAMVPNVLEHFDGNHSIKSSFGSEFVYVPRDHL